MLQQSKIRSVSVVSGLAVGICLSAISARAESVSTFSSPINFPARNDVATSDQFDIYQSPNREHIASYLHSLPWLYDDGWVQARQAELFLYFFAKLKHETNPPFVGEQDLLQWRTARNRAAYTEQIDPVSGEIEVSDRQKVWERIVEDLKVCAPLLNSDAPKMQRRAALAVVAADIPMIGAVLGDAHAARLTYEGFLLPFLDLANPEPGLWPSQSQILLDNYQWFLQDESFAKVGEMSRMMIGYGDEWLDPHYGQQMADVIRYAYGGYLKSQGWPLRAVSYWRAIKAPNLLPGAQFLSEQASGEPTNTIIDSSQP